MSSYLRLGVNIDHVATIRNARGGAHPDPVRAAELAVRAGADGITAHLREDRRHISDDDIDALAPRRRRAAQPGDGGDRRDAGDRAAPSAARRLPGARAARGADHRRRARRGRPARAHLDAVRRRAAARPASASTLFIEPAIGAGRGGGRARRRCRRAAHRRLVPRERSSAGAARAAARSSRRRSWRLGLGLECHAGHGLSYDNVGPVAAIPEIVELNIGHFLIGEAIFLGLAESIAPHARADGRGPRNGSGERPLAE